MKRLGVLYRLNRDWLTCSSLSVRERAGYYGSIISNALRPSREIRYLGHGFRYDHRFGPFLLQHYPHEICSKILGNVQQPIRTALDIGGNLGQFAVTLSRLGQGTRIDTFEPNPIAFSLLEYNVRGRDGIRVFNRGVGTAGKRTLYFSLSRSAVGSFWERNSGEGAEPCEVEVIDDVPAVTGLDTYDLVKIDVEGAELEVVEALAGVRTRYLFLELTGPRKVQPYATSDLLSAVTRNFGRFRIIYQGSLSPKSTITDALLEFVTE